MNERCPLVIILGMHHSPNDRFLKFSNNRCGYITTVPKFSGKKKSLRTSALFYQFFCKTSGSSFERIGTDDSLIMGEKIQPTTINGLLERWFLPFVLTVLKKSMN